MEHKFEMQWKMGYRVDSAYSAVSSAGQKISAGVAKKATVSVMDEKDSSVLQVKISATRAHNMIE